MRILILLMVLAAALLVRLFNVPILPLTTPPVPPVHELSKENQESEEAPKTQNAEDPTAAEISTREQPREEDTLAKLAEDLLKAKKELETIQESPRLQEKPANPTEASLPQDELYLLARERVVNFFCNLPQGEIITATGVIIHPDGYVLANAHLIEDENPQTCTLRKPAVGGTSGKAESFAIAERVFLHPDFSATSTDEEILRRDISLWRIIGPSGSGAAPLPTSFPFFNIDPLVEPQDGMRLATFTYPAEFLGFETILKSLYLSFSETTVEAHDLYFIQSVEGTGSQKGSSGGVLIDPATGSLAGMIFAISEERGAAETTMSRKLFSLTPAAIDEALATYHDYPHLFGGE